jgi:hypothetical protein
VYLVFLLIVFVHVLRSLTIVWKICLYLFGVWILRSALLKSTTLNPVDHLEHLISKVNWVNFEINSVLPSLLLVFVEKVLTCLFTPPLGNFQKENQYHNVFETSLDDGVFCRCSICGCRLVDVRPVDLRLQWRS